MGWDASYWASEQTFPYLFFFSPSLFASPHSTDGSLVLSQFGVVAENVSRGKHALTCELMEETANPNGGTEFRIISGQFFSFLPSKKREQVRVLTFRSTPRPRLILAVVAL